MLTRASYGKGPDYFQLKTAILPISMFLLLISMKFGTELENYEYEVDSYLSLFITAHAQNKQFFLLEIGNIKIRFIKQFFR